MTPVEVQAGLDPVAIQSAWQQELDWLLSQWGPVKQAQRDSLADQVAALVDKGRLDRLPGLAVDSRPGAQMLGDSMARLAQAAVAEMIREAASQGVTVDPGKVRVPVGALRKVAAARAALAGQYLAGQASRRALQVTQASKGTDAADQVSALVDSLSPVSLREQLGAALTAAQNSGRVSVLAAAPPAVYVATELLDDQTCPECRAVDGTQWGSLADAEAAYPMGGYLQCAGGDRCRGTVAALWGG
jgi:hypothetical protein